MSELRAKSKTRPVVGTCCLSTSPEFFAATKTAGLDFVFIDTEHVALPRDKLSWMCRGYDAAGITPIVRVPEPEPFRVCEYLDGGARGIVAPYVETLDQVLTLVGAVKLRPLKGGRLQECLEVLRENVNPQLLEQKDRTGVPTSDICTVLESKLGTELTEYLRIKNKNLLLFINIESVQAVASLPVLLSVPGLDGVFIGPADLSVSLGVPRQWHHERFHEAVTTIIKQTCSKGLSVGCHYSFDKAIEYQKKWVAEGADMIIHSSDVYLYTGALKQDLAALKPIKYGATVGNDTTGECGRAETGEDEAPASELDV